MESKGSASIGEEFVEERLLNGLFTGSLLQHKELLDLLEDVDSRVIKGRTLLHVGVRLGKSDWVEELLARGADPDLTDDKQMNALSSAEGMVRQFPEDLDRSLILKMVTLAHRRDQVILCRLEASSSRSTEHTCITSVGTPDQHVESLKSSVDSLKQEMKLIVRHLRSSLEELKVQMCQRDALLRCLEEVVISAPPSGQAEARQECVDAMMHRTRIVHGNGEDSMRRLYERLYDGDECTACIIKFLSGDDRVKVMVDIDSYSIGRMKEKVVYLDGTRENGSCCYSICDFENETVYLGAKGKDEDMDKACAWLAWALSQLSVKLVFDNEGTPYSKGDVEREREWMRALEDVETKKYEGGIYGCIHNVLTRKTQLAKVCYLTSAVPWMITRYGSTEGRAILQRQAPVFLSMYYENVMPTLLAKARR